MGQVPRLPLQPEQSLGLSEDGKGQAAHTVAWGGRELLRAQAHTACRCLPPSPETTPRPTVNPGGHLKSGTTVDRYMGGPVPPGSRLRTLGGTVLSLCLPAQGPEGRVCEDEETVC